MEIYFLFLLHFFLLDSSNLIILIFISSLNLFHHSYSTQYHVPIIILTVLIHCCYSSPIMILIFNLYSIFIIYWALIIITIISLFPFFSFNSFHFLFNLFFLYLQQYQINHILLISISLPLDSIFYNYKASKLIFRDCFVY